MIKLVTVIKLIVLLKKCCHLYREMRWYKFYNIKTFGRSRFGRIRSSREKGRTSKFSAGAHTAHEYGERELLIVHTYIEHYKLLSLLLVPAQKSSQIF